MPLYKMETNSHFTFLQEVTMNGVHTYKWKNTNQETGLISGPLAPINKSFVSCAPLLKVTEVISGVITPKDKNLVVQALLLKRIVVISVVVTPKDKTLVSQGPLLKVNEVIN